jgi:hypothetical protein
MELEERADAVELPFRGASLEAKSPRSRMSQPASQAQGNGWVCAGTRSALFHQLQLT